MLGLVVAVEGKVIVLVADLLDRDEKEFPFAVAGVLWVAGLPLRHHLGQFAAVDALALVIQGKAVIIEPVKPGMLGLAAPGEDEDGGGHSGVGLENAAWQGDDRLEFGLLDQLLPGLDKGAAGAEEHALGDNDASGAAGLEQGKDALGEEQLGLGSVELEGLADVALIDTAGEGRVGHDDVVFALLGEALAEGVLVIDARVVDAVHHEIHEGEADHGGIEVIAVQALLQDALIVLVEQSADTATDEAVVIGGEGLALGRLLPGELGDDILVGIEQEAGGATGGVADVMAELGIHQFTDELDNVARGAELAVFAGAADLVEQHFIDIALDVLEEVTFLPSFALDLKKDFLDDGDGALQKVGAGDEEDGIGHVVGEVAAFAVEVFDEWEDLLLDVGQHEFRLHLLKVAPAQGRLVDGVFLFSVVGQKEVAGEARDEGVAGEPGILITLEVKFIKLLHEQ